MTARCRHCRRPIYRAREVGVRAAALSAPVNARPYLGPVELVPGHLTAWELNPRLGWVCLDTPARRGHPIHIEHKCTSRQEITT